jgi:hypothetical protein
MDFAGEEGAIIGKYWPQRIASFWKKREMDGKTRQ